MKLRIGHLEKCLELPRDLSCPGAAKPLGALLLFVLAYTAFGAASPQFNLTSVQQPTPVPTAANEEAFDAAVLRLPLHFEQADSGNEPQTYRASGPGFLFSVSSSQVDMDLRVATPQPRTPDVSIPANQRVYPLARHATHPGNTVNKRITMSLVASKKNAKAVPRKLMAAKAHRLLGGDPAQWRHALPLFEAIAFEDVYKGIEVVYYGAHAQLEYDFVVAPGADPGLVRLRFTGVDRLAVDTNGDLILSLEGARVRHRAPDAFQEVEGQRRRVPASYSLVSENEVQFGVGTYDPKLPLVIDPLLSYASYLGGGSADRCWSAVADGKGNLYVVGETFSTTVSGQSGTLSSAYAGGNSVGGDAFLAKLNMENNRLEYFSYLGGSGQDGALSVALDKVGNVFVAGYTGSPNFPVTNAVQSKIAGTPERRSRFYATDAFVAKLDASGANLLYSTYLGGDGEEEGLSLAVDPSGAAYVAGQTSSTNFPVLNPIMPYQGGDDAFVAKLDPSGLSLIYSTTLGGAGVDSGEGIAVDSAGGAVVVGLSSSTNFPVRAAFQAVNAGRYDAVIFRVDPSGRGLEYSTYLGGETDDYGLRVQLDSGDQPVLVGQTYSTRFPILAALQSTNSGNGDAFVSKFAKDGQSLMFSTFLGGVGFDHAWDVALDGQDTIYVAGSTESLNFPIVDAFQTNLFGPQDAFITAIIQDGSRMVYSSYFGGPDVEEGLGLAVEQGGTAYLVGRTFSTLNLFPLTNVFQPSFGGGANDSFVARVSPIPRVHVQSTGTSVDISWAAVRPAYALEIKEGTQRLPGWVRWTGPKFTSRGLNIVRLPKSQAPRFYRLVRAQQ